MANRDAVTMERIRKEWKTRLFEPAFREMTIEKQAKELGVGYVTLVRWKRELPAETWKHIVKLSRDQIAAEAYEVDTALIKKAKTGDVAAIRLFKESIEGWSPKQITENYNINREYENLSNEELVEKILEGMGPEQRIEMSKRLRVVDAPVGEPEGVKQVDSPGVSVESGGEVNSFDKSG